MKEAGVSLNQSLMSYYQSAELTQPRSAMSLLGRLRGLPVLLVRLTATALRVCPSNFTSDGDAESRYAPQPFPKFFK